MKFRYSSTRSPEDEYDSVPRVPLILQANKRQLETNALVDSGAMVSVMPFDMGKQLGMRWNEREAKVNLGGIARGSGSMPILVSARIGDYAPVDLMFAWTKRNDVPLILGQVDFFMYFRVCFERYNLEFEITPRPKK